MTRRTQTALDLAANLVWPWLLLTFASGDDTLGPRWGPAVAMLAPLAHAFWRRAQRGHASPVSVLVIASLAINAAVGFIPLDASWFAVKEAALPVVIGFGFAATAWRGPGMVGSLLDELLDRSKVTAALAARDATAPFAARVRRGTFGFGAVMAGSGAVSGVLAAAMVHSPTGSAGFAAELGRYTAWSYGLVNLPVLLGSGLVLRSVLIALEDGTGAPIDTLLPD